MTRKNHIILDLDLTLIHTKSSTFHIPEEIIFDKNKKQNNLSYIPAPIFNSKIYLRPYLISFLTRLFKNHDVSIWTAGELRYCQFILHNILPKSYLRRLKWVVAKNRDIYNAVSGPLFIKSGFSYSDKHIPYSRIIHESSKHVFKSVESFATILREDTNRLILLDDNVGNVYHVKNSKYVYLIPEFKPSTFKVDNELLKFENWLNQHHFKHYTRRKRMIFNKPAPRIYSKKHKKRMLSKRIKNIA